MAQAKEPQSKAVPPAAAPKPGGRDAAPAHPQPPAEATPPAAPRVERNERGTLVNIGGAGQ